MSKIELKKPLLIMLYGFPGAGKTYFARNFCEIVRATHVSGDRIRNELFEKPRYDKAENNVVNHLMEYMADEFLGASVSVVFDTNAHRAKYRHKLRELARKQGAKTLLVWFQVDSDSALSRLNHRDRRRFDDKYSKAYSKEEFLEYTSAMQQPGQNEDYIVLSGKHSFQMQKGNALRRLFDLGLVNAEDVSAHVVKPGMVNLVPHGRVNMGRRNINIR